jgi:hypothetical protein
MNTQLTPAEDLVGEIQKSSHWHVRFIPSDVTPRLATEEGCANAARAAAVSRGGIYRFPEFEEYADFGGNYKIPGGWESYSTGVGLNAWRLMRSGQFSYYQTLHEDREENAQREGSNILSFIGSIYAVTDVCEFMARLASVVDYSPGLHLKLALNGMRGRRLKGGGPAPFIGLDRPRVCQSPQIRIDQPINVPIEDAFATARHLCASIFSYFGLERAEDAIVRVQEQFLAGRFS